MCSIVATIPVQATALQETLQNDGWEYYGSEIYPEFAPFWKVLNSLKEMDKTSPLCIGGCGDPTCEIRVCAQEKGLRVCAECAEFPCKLLTDFTRRYPFLVENGKRIQEIGIDAWLAEQDELVANGITNKILCQRKEKG
jgi:hypothetical protein